MKEKPVSGTGVSVTGVPLSNWTQPGPQIEPGGITATVPRPELRVVSVTVEALALKLASTVASASRVRAQSAVPEHARSQPTKIEPDPTVAWSVTCEPGAKAR